MKKIIDVPTGKLVVNNKNVILNANGIGSCVVVAGYDPENKIGALAHVMLSGKAPSKKGINKTKYAGNAINEMIIKMEQMGTNIGDIAVCFVGGGNVLKKEDDTICENNINSVIEFLNKKGIKIRAKAVGGFIRRTVALDIGKGEIYYTEGDRNKKLLWDRKRTKI